MEKLLELASRLAVRAGEAALEFYRSQELEVRYKSDDSPLTKADLASHGVIAEGLGSTSIPIVSEESDVPPAAARGGWKRFWLVDPLDGTKEFIHGRDEFTVNIALIENEEPVLGVVYAPAVGSLYRAAKGLGSFKKDGAGWRRITSLPADISRPLSVVVSRSHSTPETEAFLREIQVAKSVSAGSSLKFCLVAEGAADVYPRFGTTMEWDTAAGDCVYRDSAERGRHFCRLSYNKPDMRNGGFIVGLNAADSERLYSRVVGA